MLAEKTAGPHPSGVLETVLSLAAAEHGLSCDFDDDSHARGLDWRAPPREKQTI